MTQHQHCIGAGEGEVNRKTLCWQKRKVSENFWPGLYARTAHLCFLIGLETGHKINSENGGQGKRNMVRMKAYKIQDVNRKKRTGIVADSFADLKQKGMKKLAMTTDCRVYLEDGTEVEDDDYLNTLPLQTVFVFARPEETWEGCK